MNTTTIRNGSNSVTDAEIMALRTEQGALGRAAIVRACDDALAGDDAARAAIAAVVALARSVQKRRPRSSIF